MKSSQRSRSGKFARYAVASSAALGAAAAAKAQFAGSYTLQGGDHGSLSSFGSTGTYGTWTASETSPGGGASFVVDTTNAGSNSLSLRAISSSNTGGTEVLTFLATAATDLNVTFDFTSVGSNSGISAFSYVTANGSSYSLLSSGNHSGSGVTFYVTSGSLFGFRVTAAYGSNSSKTELLNISNFQAVTAIPEPGTAGLLAGCAAAGFVGLMAVRESRRRAKAEVKA